MHSLTNDEVRTLIMKHYRKPDNKVDKMEGNYVELHNKLSSCDDDITVFVTIENDKINNAKFKGTGCAISISSADVFCNEITNKSLKEVEKIIENYHNLLEKREANEELLGNLIMFQNVTRQPSRIKCATIASVPLLDKIKESKNG